MKRRITIKRRHASSVRHGPSGSIFTLFGRVWLSFSPVRTDFPHRLLCQPREEPNDTPFALDALLLLLLPLLFTFMKFEDEDETGERSHQFAAHSHQRDKQFAAPNPYNITPGAPYTLPGRFSAPP